MGVRFCYTPPINTKEEELLTKYRVTNQTFSDGTGKTCSFEIGDLVYRDVTAEPYDGKGGRFHMYVRSDGLSQILETSFQVEEA